MAFRVNLSQAKRSRKQAAPDAGPEPASKGRARRSQVLEFNETSTSSTQTSGGNPFAALLARKPKAAPVAEEPVETPAAARRRTRAAKKEVEPKTTPAKKAPTKKTTTANAKRKAAPAAVEHKETANTRTTTRKTSLSKTTAAVPPVEMKHQDSRDSISSHRSNSSSTSSTPNGRDRKRRRNSNNFNDRFGNRGQQQFGSNSSLASYDERTGDYTQPSSPQLKNMNQVPRGPTTYVTKCKMNANTMLKSEDVYVIGIERSRAYTIRGLFMMAPIYGGSIEVGGSILTPHPGWKNYIKKFPFDKEIPSTHVDEELQSKVNHLQVFVNSSITLESLSQKEYSSANEIPMLNKEPSFTPCYTPLSRCPPRIEVSNVQNGFVPEISEFNETYYTQKIASLIVDSRHQSDMFKKITENKKRMSEDDLDDQLVYIACIVPKLNLSTKSQFLGYQNDKPLKFYIEEIDPTGQRESVGEIVKYPASWIEARNSVKESLMTKDHRYCAAVLGGTNMGKSTFCIMMVNYLLSNFTKVAILDCDMGQSDFTPYGNVSLLVLERPVIGPAYTQMQIPERSHHIGLKGIQDIDSYVQYIMDLKKHYDQHIARKETMGGLKKGDNRIDDYVPLIVNTCGWVVGHGLDLHKKLLAELHVTNLIHFFDENNGVKSISKYTMGGLPMTSSIPGDPRSTQNTDGFRQTKYINANIDEIKTAIESKGVSINEKNIIRVTPGEQTGNATKSTAKLNRDLSIELYFFQQLQPGLPWNLLKSTERGIISNLLSRASENQVKLYDGIHDIEKILAVRMKAHRSLLHSYYSYPELFSPFNCSSSLATIVPRTIPFDLFRVIIMKSSPSVEIGDINRVMNATIVSLCIDKTAYVKERITSETPERVPQFKLIPTNEPPINATCIGLGFIRTIDPSAGIVYVTVSDSIPYSILSKVNLILLDSEVHTPNSFFEIGDVHHKAIQTSVPYTTKSKPDGIGSATWRARHNLVRSWNKRN